MQDMKKFTRNGYRLMCIIMAGIAILIAILGVVIWNSAKEDEDLWVAIAMFGFILAFVFIIILLMVIISSISYMKCSNKLTEQEKNRIEGQSQFRPKLKHLFISQDVIGYHIGARTRWILVDDIISIYPRHEMRVQSSLLPFVTNTDYIVIRTRKNKTYQIINPAKDKDIDVVFNCFVDTVHLKHPGILVGMQYSVTDINKLIPVVQEADQKIRTDIFTDYIENKPVSIEYTDIEKGGNKELILIAVMIFCYVLAYVFYQFKPTDLFVSDNYLLKDFYGKIWHTYGVGFFVALPVFISVIGWIWRSKSKKTKTSKENVIACYLCSLVISLIFMACFVGMSYELFGSREAMKDLKAYKEGKLETYEGELTVTDECNDSWIEDSKDQYHYLKGTDGYFAFYPETLVDEQLMQSNYQVVYTPTLKIVVSIKDNAGIERIALNKKDLVQIKSTYEEGLAKETQKLADKNVDCWEYGDITIPKNPQVLGYESLSEDEQMDFDFLYNETQFKPDEDIVSFMLPKPLPEDSYKKIIRLYKGNCQYDQLKRKQYQTDDYDTINKAYVSTSHFEEESYNNCSDLYRKEAEKIADQIPESLDTQDKLEWIADYLTQNVTVFDYVSWVDATDGGNDTSSPEYEKGNFSSTGYGALCNQVASGRGFMEAFGMIAKKAGIYTVPVCNEETFEYWNFICIDGNWYGVNSYNMACDPENKANYFMIQDQELENKLQNYCDTLIE